MYSARNSVVKSTLQTVLHDIAVGVLWIAVDGFAGLGKNMPTAEIGGDFKPGRHDRALATPTTEIGMRGAPFQPSDIAIDKKRAGAGRPIAIIADKQMPSLIIRNPPSSGIDLSSMPKAPQTILPKSRPRSTPIFSILRSVEAARSWGAPDLNFIHPRFLTNVTPRDLSERHRSACRRRRE